jgi:hypothetical protein
MMTRKIEISATAMERFLADERVVFYHTYEQPIGERTSLTFMWIMLEEDGHIEHALFLWQHISEVWEMVKERWEPWS